MASPRKRRRTSHNQCLAAHEPTSTPTRRKTLFTKMNPSGVRCPVCGAVESEGTVLCASCGAALTWTAAALSGSPPDVAPSEAAGGVKDSAGGVASGEQDPSLCRISCAACGHPNESWAMLCQACAKPLPSKGEPTGASPASHRTLVLEIDGKSFQCEPGDVLGREGTVAREEFLLVGTVHRRHAQLLVEDGEWWFTALASTRNLTEVDGKPVAHGERVPLRGKHSVRLSKGSKFKLIIRD